VSAVNDTISSAVANAVRWLDDHQGTGPLQNTIRILKVTEEAGEVAQAWIGQAGLNPRKGTTHTPRDVVDELADVVLTAMVAMASLGFDPEEAVTRCAAKINGRLG
jgi:NTP pyrophosphatase (non-canonical NTP hydrolase)